MKSLCLIILALISVQSFSQIYIADRIQARKGLAVKDYWISGIENDTSFTDATKIPTSAAVREFVEGRMAGGGSTPDLNQVLGAGWSANKQTIRLLWRSSFGDIPNVILFDSTTNRSVHLTSQSLLFSYNGYLSELLPPTLLDYNGRLTFPQLSTSVPNVAVVNVNGEVADRFGRVNLQTFYKTYFGQIDSTTEINGQGFDFKWYDFVNFSIAAQSRLEFRSEDSLIVEAPGVRFVNDKIQIGRATFEQTETNLSIGHEAGDYATGYFNTWLGKQAGAANSGNFNLGIGVQAGSGNAKDYTISLGYTATPDMDSQMVISPEIVRLKMDGLSGTPGDVLTKGADGNWIAAPAPAGGTDTSMVVKVDEPLMVHNVSDTPHIKLAIPAFSSLVNYTNAPGFQLKAERIYIDTSLTETITFAGTTAPSGTVNNRISAKVEGKEVTVYIFLNYSEVGVANTSVTIPLPSWLPTPNVPADWLYNGAVLYNGSGSYGATRSNQSTAIASLRLNSTATGFEIILSRSSTSFRFGTATITYITN